MDELVQRLAQGEHKVEVTIRPEKTMEEFQACLERKYVHITFTETRGGTELGVRLDDELTDLSGGDFERQQGTVKLVGTLTLNYVNVRCTAIINLRELTGTGHLEALEEEERVATVSEAAW
jgi:hypothetical protein